MLTAVIAGVVDHPCIKHWTVASTMRYVRPSETFIEDAYRKAISTFLTELTDDEE